MNLGILKLENALFNGEETKYFAVLTSSVDNQIVSNLKDNIECANLSASDDDETNIFVFEKGGLLFDAIARNEGLRNKAVLLSVTEECKIGALKKHLNSLSKAIVYTGEIIKLPICEPSFLVRYLPSCNEDDIEAVFEIIQKYTIWDQDDSKALLVFEKGDAKVESKMIEV